MTPLLNNLDPKNLKPHPLNELVYGDKPDEDFIDSCKDGIIEPIHITSENCIISGHRRHAVALELEMDTVPVMIRYDISDPIEIERALILANKYREKTNEQKAREYKELKRIEDVLAKARKEESKFGGKKNSINTNEQDPSHGEENVFPTVSDPQDVGGTTNKKGKARDLAANEVGWSGPTAEAAREVVDEIDRATEKGDTETAEDLKQTLNKKGVAPAKKKVEEAKAPKEKPPKKELSEAQKKIKAMRSPFNSLISRIGRMKTEFKELKGEEGSGGEFVNQVMIEDFEARADALAAVVSDVLPKECTCDGEGCTVCKWLGYVRNYGG